MRALVLLAASTPSVVSIASEKGGWPVHHGSPADGHVNDYKDFSYEPPAKEDAGKPWTQGGTVSRILYHPVTGAKMATLHYELHAHGDKQAWDEARVMRTTTHCAPSRAIAIRGHACTTPQLRPACRSLAHSPKSSSRVSAGGWEPHTRHPPGNPRHFSRASPFARQLQPTRLWDLPGMDRVNVL